jgi:hypothetical protein
MTVCKNVSNYDTFVLQVHVDYGSLHSDFGEVSVQEESTSLYHISWCGSGKTVQSHLKL